MRIVYTLRKQSSAELSQQAQTALLVSSWDTSSHCTLQCPGSPLQDAGTLLQVAHHPWSLLIEFGGKIHMHVIFYFPTLAALQGDDTDEKFSL